MLLKILVLFVATLGSLSEAEKKITATGGGVVEQGKSLRLSYGIDDTNKDWFMCTWRRNTFNNGVEVSEYCMFTDSGGSITKQKCDPSDFMESNYIEYAGVDKSECAIKVNNVSADDSTTWAVNIESDIKNTEIIITVATPLENITLRADAIQVGEDGILSCTVTGGNPVPAITFKYGSNSDNTALNVTGNRTQVTTRDENGKLTTVANVTIAPEVKDHGRQIDCAAVQSDSSDTPQVLFADSQGVNGTLSAIPINLNIIFPPQAKDNQTFSGVKGAPADISFSFMVNPTPTKIKWVVKDPNDTTSNNTDNQAPSTNETLAMNVTIELPPTENQTRYVVQNVSEDNAPQFVAGLTISDLVDSDHLNIFYLEVTNSLGTTKYYFDVNITDFVTTTTPKPTTTTVAVITTKPEGKGSSGTVTAVVVIIVILILIVGGVIFYKKYYLQRQTVPHYNLR